MSIRRADLDYNQSASCKVLTCASSAWEYSRSAMSSDCSFFTSPSRRMISIFSLATSTLARGLLATEGLATGEGNGIVATALGAGAGAGAAATAVAIAGTGRGPG